MRFLALSTLAAFAAWSSPVQALTMSDSLATWKDGTAMDRMQFATRISKRFVTMDEGFTAAYFLKCIDEISGFGNAKDAKVEDAVRECVAAPMRQAGQPDE